MMQEGSISEWQQAVALYRDVSAMPEADRKRHINALDESADVRANREQLLHSTHESEATPVEDRVAQLIARLGRASDAFDPSEFSSETVLGWTIGNWTAIRDLG